MRTTNAHKLLLGGAGALTPILLNLLVTDATTVFRNLTLIVLATYVLKVAILIYLGGIVAWLHRRESDPLRLFELGIVAPALLTTLANGSRTPQPTAPSVASTSSVGMLTWFLPGQLLAEPAGARDSTYSFRNEPPETVKEQVVRGFLSRTSRGTWFVCLRQGFATAADASLAASQLRVRYAIPTRVYRPEGGPSGYYTIVMTDWVTRDAAEQVGLILRRRGLDVFEWSPR